MIIKVTKFNVEDAKAEYPHLWDTFHSELPNLSDEDIATAISITTGVCSSCWERPNRCSCWNDE